jgi:hypothetical protein
MTSYPTIKDLSALFVALKSDIGDEYRAQGDEDATTPSMDVTIGHDPESGNWDYQTGDNSYTGNAYGYQNWAVTALRRRANSRDLARDVINQLKDLGY